MNVGRPSSRAKHCLVTSASSMQTPHAELQNFRTSEFDDFKTSELQNFRTSEFDDYKTSELLDSRTSELQKLRISELQDFRTSGLQHFKLMRCFCPHCIVFLFPHESKRAYVQRTYALRLAQDLYRGSLKIDSLAGGRCFI